MIDYDKKSVGERIRSKRKALGLTQEGFAERIDCVPKFCADIEGGKKGMSITTMLKICSLLKMTPDELFGFKESNINDETDLIISALNKCTERQRKDAVELLKLFIAAIK